MSWFDDNELSSGADTIGWNSLKKKKINKKFGHIEINKIKAKAKKKRKEKEINCRKSKHQTVASMLGSLAKLTEERKFTESHQW